MSARSRTNTRFAAERLERTAVDYVGPVSRRAVTGNAALSVPTAHPLFRSARVSESAVLVTLD
ncbi:hypothetical protein [Natrinema gelatinilyticum]|uniref:hypothetical protein n=1 Tax=Natrinema gelatinilyticum TaxID=2961571 RepID=UPI0020C2EE76|nr:hypothetical protein [Natrinema gelatinilyticum]